MVLAAALAALCGAPLPSAAAPQDNSTKIAAKKKPPAKKSAKRKGKASSKKKTVARKRRRPVPPRVARITQAFVASADLKPMAMQLVQHRSAAAYTGVENYARKHAGEDVGSLAWLVAGYCHYFDHEYAQAIPPLQQARAHAGELDDYVDYLLAYSYLQTGRADLAVSAIGEFNKNFNDSVLEDQAAVLYGAALTASGRASEAVRFLAPRPSPRPPLLLALGKAYAAAGQRSNAVATLRQIYFDYPLTVEADEANEQLQGLARSAALPPPTDEQRRHRIEGLLAGRRADDAARELKDLLKNADDVQKANWNLALATAYFQQSRYADMQKALEKVPDSTSDRAAQKLYYKLEDDRPDQSRVLDDLAHIRNLAPASAWMQKALLSTGNMYLLVRDYPNAVQSYNELITRFPSAASAGTIHWRIAWLTYRMKDFAGAKRLFQEQVRLYPSSQEVASAWYWLGRIAEQQNDRVTAGNDYRYVAAHYRMTYYGVIARSRLVTLGMPGEVPADSALGPNRIYVVDDPPPDNLRAQKALLLENAALFDYAIAELQKADSSEPWALAQMVRIYQDAGRYDRGLRLLKRSLPGYYSWDVARLPRFLWEGLFPRPYWSDLTRYSTENGLDPLIVAALVRQESEFNPLAVSRAAAIGLMQLLPGTGKKTARDLKLRHFSPSELYDPTTNLQLGTAYFRQMLNRFDGHIEYALAAYNAGSDRVDNWRSADYAGMDEFVESIPFTETRDYVQAIVRNAAVYKMLYDRSPQEARK